MSACIDVTDLYPPRSAPVCLRGRVGCPVVHEVGAPRPLEVEPVRELPQPGLRWSDDFKGCVE